MLGNYFPFTRRAFFLLLIRHESDNSFAIADKKVDTQLQKPFLPPGQLCLID